MAPEPLRTRVGKLLRRIRYEAPRPRLLLRAGKLRARRSDRRRVLLVGRNQLLIQYLGRIRDLFRSDPRIGFTLTSSRHDSGTELCRRLAGEMGLPYLSRSASLRRWWDLAVFPDHNVAHRYAPGIPKLRIQHAITDGKILGGAVYRYDPRLVLTAGGRPLYTLIFDSSCARRDRVVREIPALAGRIAVVGDLRADEMLALRPERDRIREEMGFAGSDRVVVLCSTWGPDSLVETMGDRLFAAARGIAGCRFVVSAHPLLWSLDRPRGKTWDEELRSLRSHGISVLEPDDDWAPAFVASDAMLTDHTSLAAMYALLEKPLAFVPLPAEAVGEGTVLSRLYRASPRLADPGLLGELLDRLFSDRPDFEATTDEILCHPGRAAERMRAEIYGLLGISPGIRGESGSRRKNDP